MDTLHISQKAQSDLGLESLIIQVFLPKNLIGLALSIRMQVNVFLKTAQHLLAAMLPQLIMLMPISMHDIVTGKSVTAVLHLLNGTPIDWYSKRQSTVETATYGSEFVAARTAIDQITELRHSLRYLGVPIRRAKLLVRTITDLLCSMQPFLTPYYPRDTIFCHTTEFVKPSQPKYVAFYWKDGKTNPADILSKHWDFVSIWPMLKPLLFWKGEVQDLNKSNDDKAETTRVVGSVRILTVYGG